MSDPITTIVTVISEHPQAAAAVASIYGVAKPFLAKILGPGAEELGEIGRDLVKGYRAKNANRTLSKAATLLAVTGREAQAVPMKLLEPLLNAASSEDDASLADKWATLLANAADPVQRITVQPGFVEVLRQLMPEDARMLDALCAPEADPKPDAVPDWKKVKQLLARVGLSFEQARLPVDNLKRLHLCKFELTYGGEAFQEEGQVAPTFFGQQFLAACTAPVT